MNAPWTRQDEERLRRLYPTYSASELAPMLGRTKAAVKQRAIRLGLRKTGNAGRFAPGNRPWNVGMKGWTAGGRSAETRFKPGAINGRAAELLQPLGTERLSKDGIRERKVRSDGARRWKSVHALLWEEANGPIPEGYIVAFRDRDRTNLSLDNLELISRGENMRRNSVHRLPQELALAVQLKGALQRQINKRMKA